MQLNKQFLNKLHLKSNLYYAVSDAVLYKMLDTEIEQKNTHRTKT